MDSSNDTCGRSRPAAAVVMLAICLGQPVAGAEPTPHDVAKHFNEAMNRCMSARCSNVDEILSLFTDDATWADDTGTVRGKAAIKKSLLLPYEANLRDDVQGIDLMDTVVVLRLERRREFKTGKYSGAEVRPHVELLVFRGDKIERVISVLAPVRPSNANNK